MIIRKQLHYAVPPMPGGCPLPCGPETPGSSLQMGKMSPQDDSLTMLAEYCTKTVATVGGDGYTEWVLNRCADGTLQLDYYRNYMGYEEEIHRSCPAPADTWDRICRIRKKYLPRKLPAERKPVTCGGYSVVKFSENGEMFRLFGGSLTEKEQKAFTQIMEILTTVGV